MSLPRLSQVAYITTMFPSIDPFCVALSLLLGSIGTANVQAQNTSPSAYIETLSKAASIHKRLIDETDANVKEALQVAFEKVLQTSYLKFPSLKPAQPKELYVFKKLTLNAHGGRFEAIRFKVPAGPDTWDMAWEFVIPKHSQMQSWQILPASGQMRGFTNFWRGENFSETGADLPTENLIFQQRLLGGKLKGDAEYLIWFCFADDTPLDFYIRMRVFPYDIQNRRDSDWAIQDFTQAIRRNPKSANAYLNRADAWIEKQDYDEAIKDCDEAIRLKPKVAGAFQSRGFAWFAKSEYDKAIKEYDEATRLDPENSGAQFSRSMMQMVMRRSESAKKGFQRVLELQRWKAVSSSRAVILGHLAARQAGDEVGAKRFLEDSAGKLDEVWPYQMVKFLRGEIDQDAVLEVLLNDANEANQTEALCYLGLDRALKGPKDEALRILRGVKEITNVSLIHYRIALAELDRLELPPKVTE